VEAGELVFSSKKFAVRRRYVELSPGCTHAYDIVSHPGAAIALPLLPDGQVVLIRTYRLAVDQELLELPAGTVDPPESPIECARRELAEETGYRAERLEPLVSFYSTPGICSEHMHIFLATVLHPGPMRLEPREQIRLAPLPLEEALRQIERGRIVDGKTIVGLLYYRLYRQPESCE